LRSGCVSLEDGMHVHVPALVSQECVVVVVRVATVWQSRPSARGRQHSAK